MYFVGVVILLLLVLGSVVILFKSKSVLSALLLIVLWFSYWSFISLAAPSFCFAPPCPQPPIMFQTLAAGMTLDWQINIIRYFSAIGMSLGLALFALRFFKFTVNRSQTNEQN